MAEDSQQWFELVVVVRTTADLLAKLRDAVDGSDLAEIDRWDLTPLDEDRCRWDGSAATRTLGVPEPAIVTLDLLER